MSAIEKYRRLIYRLQSWWHGYIEIETSDTSLTIHAPDPAFRRTRRFVKAALRHPIVVTIIGGLVVVLVAKWFMG